MGNRSRFMTAGAAIVGGAGLAAARRKRRRERLGEAVVGIADTIMPSVAEDVHRVEELPVTDVAHAPVHTHLAPPGEAREERVLKARRFGKRDRGLPEHRGG
jgi:hypothetical protein